MDIDETVADLGILLSKAGARESRWFKFPLQEALEAHQQGVGTEWNRSRSRGRNSEAFESTGAWMRTEVKFKCRRLAPSAEGLFPHYAQTSSRTEGRKVRGRRERRGWKERKGAVVA